MFNSPSRCALPAGMRTSRAKATMRFSCKVLFITFPIHANGVAFLVIMQVQFTLTGMTQGLADSARKVDVRRLDDDGPWFFFNPHDSMQRVFSVFLLLLMPHQTQDFILMRP